MEPVGRAAATHKRHNRETNNIRGILLAKQTREEYERFGNKQAADLWLREMTARRVGAPRVTLLSFFRDLRTSKPDQPPDSFFALLPDDVFQLFLGRLVTGMHVSTRNPPSGLRPPAIEAPECMPHLAGEFIAYERSLPTGVDEPEAESRAVALFACPKCMRRDVPIAAVEAAPGFASGLVARLRTCYECLVNRLANRVLFSPDELAKRELVSAIFRFRANGPPTHAVERTCWECATRVLRPGDRCFARVYDNMRHSNRPFCVDCATAYGLSTEHCSFCTAYDPSVIVVANRGLFLCRACVCKLMPTHEKLVAVRSEQRALARACAIHPHVRFTEACKLCARNAKLEAATMRRKAKEAARALRTAQTLPPHHRRLVRHRAIKRARVGHEAPAAAAGGDDGDAAAADEDDDDEDQPGGSESESSGGED